MGGVHFGVPPGMFFGGGVPPGFPFSFGGGLGGDPMGFEDAMGDAARPGTEHYEVLGVAPSATPEEIRKAYLVLSRKFHTDRVGGDKDKFQKIALAKEVLLDPELRDAYDKGGDAAVEQAKLTPIPPITVSVECDLADTYTGTTVKTVSYPRMVRKPDGEKESQQATATVVVPAGAATGLKLVQEHAGHLGRGPLVLEFRVRDVAGVFRRVSLTDVQYEAEVPLWQAIAGAAIEVPPVVGHEAKGGLRVAVPGPLGRVIKPGDKIEVRGFGLPVLCPPGGASASEGPQQFGSLIVVCRVVFPTQLPHAVALNVAHALGGDTAVLDASSTSEGTLLAVDYGEDEAHARHSRAEANAQGYKHQAHSALAEGAGLGGRMGGATAQAVSCATQ